jgi:hypothetical protein
MRATVAVESECDNDLAARRAHAVVRLLSEDHVPPDWIGIEPLPPNAESSEVRVTVREERV